MSDISLLFLTYSNISHIDKFDNLFEHCNVYIHPKYPDQLNSNLKKYVIPNLVETKWGDKSIITATIELLKEAFKNNQNRWFILCSEDIYPLVDYNELNTYLNQQQYSIFDVMDAKVNKTSQFWALTRDDVSKILSNKDKWDAVFKSVPNKKAFDELFFLNVLKRVDKSYKFTNSKFCYVKWFRNIIAKHPTKFNCLLEFDVNEISSNHSCFIRKTYPTFKNIVCPKKNVTILVTVGSESVTNVSQFMEDFKDIANIFILSLLDNVDNNELTTNCCQTYYSVWNDAENAKNIIKAQFSGDVIITSEKFNLNNLKTLLNDGQLLDEKSNPYEINFDISKLNFFSVGYMSSENNALELEDKKEESDKNEESKQNEEQMNNLNEESDKNEATNKNEVLLNLGDIIMIYDQTNEILNENIFYIEYIDSKKIKLINSETFEKTILPISTDGIIGDGNIQSIKIISSNPEKGYARQNGLLPGIWINIYFGGEIPTVITGEITNIEEDMIEIRTTDGDIIYFNFDYHGIPEDFPIETFEIRPAIKEKEKEEQNEFTADELVELGEEEEQSMPTMIPKTEIKNKIQKVMFDMADLDFGDIVKIEEYVNIDKEKYRYSIEMQTNDMLEEMLSEIPNAKRTNNVLNNIHIMITRFIQLRQLSSTFDSNKNINGIIKRTAEDRPLAEYLSDFKNTLYWIMMVAKNVKKIYEDERHDAEYKRYNDYEIFPQDASLVELSSLFINKKYNKDARNNGKKYTNFTYQQFDNYMTPFYSINPDSSEDVFAKPNGIIIEGNVETNVNAIIDNLGALYSTVVDRSNITNRKFIIQRYNLGQDKLVASSFKGSHLTAQRVKLTPNDQISINSIITLPEPTVRFSQINLPGSNLLVKANLNLHFLNYWKLLKQKTELTPIVIDGLDNEIEYDDTNFVDNIKQYLLDLSEYEKPPELTNLDIYKIFLRTIIPKIRVLFSLVKKYIKGRLSLVDVVNYLEPFMIYPIDLTYLQYKEINSFIYDKIKDYNKIFKEYSVAFSSIRYIKNITSLRPGKEQWNYTYSNVLFTLLNDDAAETDLEMRVFQDYGFDDYKHIECSGSEFLKRIKLADYGNLYNTAVALTNIKLMYPTQLSTIMNNDKNSLKPIIEKDKESDKCSSVVIAKKYYSMDSLNDDNEKPIYYDREFDTTNYDLLEKTYKKEKNSLSKDEFIDFLIDKFVTKDKMDEATAEYMALTLINQAKKVREGDYALLVSSNEIPQNEISQNEIIPQGLEYYVRQNDIWVLDKNIDPSNFIKDDDVLCNMNLSCIYNSEEKGEDKCESTTVAKDTIVNNALKKIIDEFDKNYEISKDELNSRINKQLDYFEKIFDKLQQIKRNQFFKYNNQQYELGLTVADEIKDRKVSPYIKLRNLIMGQNDFVKKQTDILGFVSLYCREGDPNIPNINDNEMENEWWLYCKETDTKLLPKFVYILADTFITKNNKYDDVLNELKRKIGKRSDDGDSWVDENSGEVICYIDLDVEEGYKDGFVDKSRDIIEKDIGETILEKQKDKKDRRLSPEGELVSNIVSVLSHHMGLDIEQSRDFIVKVVTELMNDVKIIEKEPAYKKREEEAAKKGKKLPTYVALYSSTLMYLTLGTYLIAVQTSIPSLKTRKTAPGCVRSFTGFPFEGEGDDSGLNYVACTALKSRDASTVPWNSLPKNEEKIATTLKSFIVKYLLPYSEVERKIKEKTIYLLENPEETIPEEYTILKWTNFLPPLKRFHINHLENVTDGFTEELQNELYNGNNRQLEKMLVVESKIISYSLAIQESIQKIVDKKNLLLKSSGTFFMDNACCNEQEKNKMTCLQYFVNDDKNIEFYNNIVINLTALIRDINLLTESAIMLSDVNTKRIYPMVTNEFSEETIYHAFITLCKFQSSVPLDEQLATVCVDKPDYLNKMDTIQEKIEKLKRDGRNYTKEQFLRLFQIVSRNNIIQMALSKKNASCIDNLKHLLTVLDEENNENVPKALTQKLEKIVDMYDASIQEDTRDMRELKNYLQTSNDLMKKDVIDFIKTKGKIGSLEFKNISKFLNELSVWNYDKNPRNVDIKISDDGLYNYINFYKNFISLFAVVFPSMIINQKMQTILPPKYWKVSQNHANDIKEMVSSFYEPIEKFYGSNTIKNVLTEIISKCRGVYLLSNNTPVLTKIQIDEKELYSSFDKRTITLLYEYYFLSILNDYINLTKDPSMVTRMLSTPEKEDTDTFSTDFLIEQQLRFSESEQEFIEGDVMKLKQEVAKLLIAYLNIMMRSKKTLNVSYSDIEDKVFKLKEAEKYDFTDALRDMDDDTRAVDTILKHHKLGPIYSIGLSKGLREYDADNFEHDKRIAEKVAAIQNKLIKNKNVSDQDMDMAVDDDIYEQNIQYDIDMDMAGNINLTDDYDNGDPYGDEEENYDDYN